MMLTKVMSFLRILVLAMLVFVMENTIAGDTGTANDSDFCAIPGNVSLSRCRDPEDKDEEEEEEKNKNATSTITVPYSIEGINQDDVLEDGKLKGNVEFKKGENSKTITIKLKKDAKKSGDADPKFSLGETDDKKVTRGKNNSVAIKLPDTSTTTESTFVVLLDTSTSVTQKEGAEGETTSFSFPLKLEGFPLSNDVTVEYSLAGVGDAGSPGEPTTFDIAGRDDFVGINVGGEGVLTIPAGATSANIVLQVKGDAENELDEKFGVYLDKVNDKDPLTKGQFVIGTILNDDKPAEQVATTPSIQANREIIVTPNVEVESGGVVSLDARGTGVFYKYTLEPGAHTERWEGFCVPGIADRATIEDNSSKTIENNFSKKGPAPFNFIDGKIVFENDTLKTTWTAPINTTNEVMTCKLTVIASNKDGNAFAQSVVVTVLPTKQVADTNLVDDKLTPKPKKEFKLVENSRKFLLFDSRLINGVNIVQENSFTNAVNAAIKCPNGKTFLCSDMTCAVSEAACTTTTTTTTITTIVAAPPEICGNGLDDDLDTLIDFADVADCTPTADETAFCFDGLDNDGDGFADILDSDCIPEICGNFFDDDMDGDTDFADAECTPTAESIGAGNCADGLDNDNDGLADTDAECSATTPLTLVTGLPFTDNDAFNDIVIVVDGANNLSAVLGDPTVEANALFGIFFTGFGMGTVVPAPGVVSTGPGVVGDGANTLGFTRAGTDFEININLTIITDDNTTVNAGGLSGSNCGAGPC